MPTYSYACTECDNRFDVVQSFTDQSLTVCPRCEGRLRKLFNSVGIVFKGSGFYRTDSRDGAKADVAASSESSGDKKADAPKTDAAKPAAKADSSSSASSSGSGSSSTGSSSSSASSSSSSSSAAGSSAKK